MHTVWKSVRRARREIIGVAFVYAVSVTVGAVQVHRGNAFALRYGDDLVYSIAGGVGVRLGLSYFRDYPEYRGERKWLGYPIGALRDVLHAYAVITPLFLIASLWEFLSTWN
jgi:hypothetical protein